MLMYNIPSYYDKKHIKDLLNKHQLKYDFLHVPLDFKDKAALGYAVINFETRAERVRFDNSFSGFSAWEPDAHGRKSPKVCEIKEPLVSGKEANIGNNRNSFVMKMKDDDFHPEVFVDGERMPFPKPTKTIKRRRKKGERNRLHSPQRREAAETDHPGLAPGGRESPVQEVQSVHSSPLEQQQPPHLPQQQPQLQSQEPAATLAERVNAFRTTLFTFLHFFEEEERCGKCKAGLSAMNGARRCTNERCPCSDWRYVNTGSQSDSW